MHITSEAVAQVFQSVSSVYDLMINAMSFGLHHTWKDMLVDQLPLSKDKTSKILDMATGTGDIAVRLLKRAQREEKKIELMACDACEEMLARGKEKNPQAPWTWGHEDALCLSFASDQFDGYVIAFGLRNVLPFYQGLKEAYRVLKPGG